MTKNFKIDGGKESILAASTWRKDLTHVIFYLFLKVSEAEDWIFITDEAHGGKSKSSRAMCFYSEDCQILIRLNQ